ncbi:hypothetical protein D7024_01475 [Desulfofundulus salinus]|uniref:Uncharacterized protein n=1 Tax=Desulfofundulus salinus TaxID=2419843 RepID=A0A494WRE7_9FIRM|nr:hypothetical protein D7024_01475 [Desulfofundulus salinum]
MRRCPERTTCEAPVTAPGEARLPARLSRTHDEPSRGAVGAEHWSERGQRRIQPGSLNIDI